MFHYKYVTSKLPCRLFLHNLQRVEDLLQYNLNVPYVINLKFSVWNKIMDYQVGIIWTTWSIYILYIPSLFSFRYMPMNKKLKILLFFSGEHLVCFLTLWRRLDNSSTIHFLEKLNYFITILFYMLVHWAVKDDK